MSSNNGLSIGDKIAIIGIILATIIGIATIIVTIIIAIAPEYFEFIIPNKSSDQQNNQNGSNSNNSDPDKEKVLCPPFIGPDEEIDESCL